MPSTPHQVVVTNQVPMPRGGGPHGLVRAIADQLARDGASGPQPTIVLEDRVVPAADVAELCRRRGLEPEIGMLARLRRIVGQYRTLDRLRRAHGALDVIQFEVPKSAAVLRLLHPRTVRLVVSEHSKGGLDVEARIAGARRSKVLLVRATVLVAFTVADRIVWPSAGAMDEYYRGHRRSRLHDAKHAVVHNGIRIDPDAPVDGGRGRALVLVALDVPDKNVRGLLGMLEQVATTTGDRLRVEWFGGPVDFDASGYAHLEVVSHGKVGNDVVRASLARARGFVAFPHRTIFDLAVLEAMSVATPVLCPPLGGFVEALGQDYPLYVRDAGELAAALRRLDDDSSVDEVGEGLRRRALRLFTVEHMLDGYLTVLDGPSSARTTRRDAELAGALRS